MILINKQPTNLSWLWWWVIIYNVIAFIGEFFNNIMIFKLLSAIAIAIVMFVLIKFISFNFSDRWEIRIVYLPLLLWVIIMFCFSGVTNLTTPFNYLYTYGILPYSAMLLLLIPTKLLLQSFMPVIYKINAVYLLLFFIPLVFFNNEYKQFFFETFAIGSGIIYITNKYHSPKTCLIALLSLILAFLVATLTARRNLMLTFGMYILMGSILLIVNGKIKSIEVKFISILCGFALLLGSIFFYLQESSGAFSQITGRATENTREEVFIAYAIDMANIKDLVLGRGVFGQYYCPGVEKDEFGISNDYRGNIECGYLQWILKGGVIYLVLYLSLFCIAIFRGLRSSNQLSKGCALTLLVQLIDMISFGLHAFNIKTFIIWMAVAICLDHNMNKMNDNEIMNIILKKKNKLLPWQKN